MYAGTKDMKNTAITIQYRYYYVKYQSYDHLTDLLPVVQSKIISCTKYESSGWDEF